MRLNQGFVIDMQFFWGKKLPDPFYRFNTRGQFIDKAAPGKVCIDKYTLIPGLWENY